MGGQAGDGPGTSGPVILSHGQSVGRRAVQPVHQTPAFAFVVQPCLAGRSIRVTGKQCLRQGPVLFDDVVRTGSDMGIAGGDALSIGAAHQHGTDGEGGHNGRIDRTFSTWAPIWAACQFCVTTMPALLRTIFLLICSVRDKLCERRSVGDIVNTLRSCEIGRRTGHKRTVRHESRHRKYAGSGDHGAAGDELGHRAGHEIAFPYSGLSG